MDAPCKNCLDRHFGCHSDCEKYREYDKFRKDILNRRSEENRLNYDLWQTSRHSKKRKRRD